MFVIQKFLTTVKYLKYISSYDKLHQKAELLLITVDLLPLVALLITFTEAAGKLFASSIILPLDNILLPALVESISAFSTKS